MSSLEKIQFLGNYINGKFVVPERADGNIKDISPGDLDDQIMTVNFCSEHVDLACESAQKAFLSWSHLPLEERKKCLMRLREVYIKHENDIAVALARDTGKPLWESLGEAKKLSQKIDLTIEHFIHYVEEQKIHNTLPNLQGKIRYKPRGVMAIIGSFNRPAALANEQIIPALLTGNTVILKPSEYTPFVGQLNAQIIDEANFPAGVFNMVHGGREVGKKLVGHDLVNGVLFIGSYDVGVQIKQATFNHYWKILALELGGKNASIVWEDADLDKALYETLVSSFITSGQRSSSTSRIVLHEKIADQFLDRFYKAAKKLTIGYWDKNPFMGPLISADAVDKYIRFQEIARREGCEILMRGKALDIKPKGHYVTPSITMVNEFNSKSVYQTNEIFGPNVAVYRVKDFDQAATIVNGSGFGMAAAIFTRSADVYEKSYQDIQVGMLNWNRGTTEISPMLPLSGLGKSGNDRPSGSSSVFYCTSPTACLEDQMPFDKSNILPGIEWD